MAAFCVRVMRVPQSSARKPLQELLDSLRLGPRLKAHQRSGSKLREARSQKPVQNPELLGTANCFYATQSGFTTKVTKAFQWLNVVLTSVSGPEERVPGVPGAKEEVFLVSEA